MNSCACVTIHRPKVHRFNQHHILPKSWGGTNVENNVVSLCPTAHGNVHTLLNHYVRAGATPPGRILRRYSRYTRMLAKRAWDQRPSDKPPWTSPEDTAS